MIMSINYILPKLRFQKLKFCKTKLWWINILEIFVRGGYHNFATSLVISACVAITKGKNTGSRLHGVDIWMDDHLDKIPCALLLGKSGWRSEHQPRLPAPLQILYVDWVSVDLKMTLRVFSGHSGFLPPHAKSTASLFHLHGFRRP